MSAIKNNIVARVAPGRINEDGKEGISRCAGYMMRMFTTCSGTSA
jgi:hypothetical protein